jgi:hypothetical protein
MDTLPLGSLLVRTWFGGDNEWQQLKAAIETPSEEGFLANVNVIEDRAHEGNDADALKAMTPRGRYGALVSFIADKTTLTTEGWPMLVVWVLPADPDDEREFRPFRVVASKLWSVENNLNLANLDWDDFQGAVDAHGVFRGF